MQSTEPGRIAAAIGLFTLPLAVGVVSVAALSVRTTGLMGGGMMGGGMMGGSAMLASLILLFAFVSLIALAVVGYAVARTTSEGGGSSRDGVADDAATDPVDRLRERYVAGDLTEAEFEQALDRTLDGGDDSGDGSASMTPNDRAIATEDR